MSPLPLLDDLGAPLTPRMSADQSSLKVMRVALDSLPQSVFEKSVNKDLWEEEPHGVPQISGHRVSKAAAGPISFPALASWP